MIVFLAVAALLVAAIALFMNRPEFGRAPRGERLERIWRSPNYRDGAFRNRHATPQLTSGKGWWATMYDFLFERKERNRPDHALPAVKTDLKALDPKENLLVWFGHSSYLIQADGLRILVDPVFETASPLPFFNRPFEGTDLYKPEDMPGIDLLVITHDHWDHLDYGTVTKLRDRTGRVVCPLRGRVFRILGFRSAADHGARLGRTSCARRRLYGILPSREALFPDVRFGRTGRCGLRSSSKLRRSGFSSAATAGTIPISPTSHASFRIWMSPCSKTASTARIGAISTCFRPI